MVGGVTEIEASTSACSRQSYDGRINPRQSDGGAFSSQSVNPSGSQSGSPIWSRSSPKKYNAPNSPKWSKSMIKSKTIGPGSPKQP